MRYERHWSFHNPVRIVSGSGSISDLSSHVEERGAGTGIIVTSPGFTKRGLSAGLAERLGERQVEIIDDVSPNPTVESIEAYRDHIGGRNIAFVVGLGGGSVLDTAKSLSCLLGLEDRNFSLKEHLAEGLPLPDDSPVPLTAVPTTAGTGSEVTPFATLWDGESGKKYSLTRPDLYPATALLDAELTLTLPEEITIVTGLDVLSHALESVWNVNAGPVSISCAARAIDIALNTLPVLLEEPRNLERRAKMLTGSLFGGLCISATRTALAHSMSYPVTARLGVPHGLACSYTLPALLKFNARFDDGRMALAAKLAGCGSVEGLLQRVEELFERVGVEKLLAGYDVKAENVMDLADQMFTPERSGNNLGPAGLEEVRAILKESVPG